MSETANSRDNQDTQQNAQNTDFNFDEWIDQIGLNRKTTAILRSNDCATKQALNLLTMSDVKELGLTVGQRNVLMAAVKQLQTNDQNPNKTQLLQQHEQGGVDKSQTTQVADVTMDQLLQSLKASTSSSAAAAAPTNIASGNTVSALLADPLSNLGITQAKNQQTLDNMRADLDPLVYLSNPNPDYYDILDFIPHFTAVVNEEHSILNTDDIQLVFKSGPKRPKLQQVDQALYMVASSRILAKLIQSGKISLNQVAQYLAYQVKIGMLGQRYDWYSVLLYDREYRRMQAAYNFPWGSDSQHLAQVHLVEKSKLKSLAKQTVKRSEHCKLYNHSTCMYGDRCRYIHACSICNKAHPQNQHPRD